MIFVTPHTNTRSCMCKLMMISFQEISFWQSLDRSAMQMQCNYIHCCWWFFLTCKRAAKVKNYTFPTPKAWPSAPSWPASTHCCLSRGFGRRRIGPSNMVSIGFNFLLPIIVAIILLVELCLFGSPCSGYMHLFFFSFERHWSMPFHIVNVRLESSCHNSLQRLLVL